MAIEVDTKDCTALSDAELAEMADLCADSTNAFEVGMLSKQAEAWVLCTVASEGGKIRGFSFCTLERIGGTPSVLVGAAHICRNTKRDTVLRAIVTDQLRRSVLAFPDEDVLVGAQMNDAGAFEAYKSLTDIVPRPDHKASGEERAWGVASPSASVSVPPSTRTAPSPSAATVTRRSCSIMRLEAREGRSRRHRPVRRSRHRRRRHADRLRLGDDRGSREAPLIPVPGSRS